MGVEFCGELVGGGRRRAAASGQKQHLLAEVLVAQLDRAFGMFVSHRIKIHADHDVAGGVRTPVRSADVRDLLGKLACERNRKWMAGTGQCDIAGVLGGGGVPGSFQQRLEFAREIFHLLGKGGVDRRLTTDGRIGLVGRDEQYLARRRRRYVGRQSGQRAGEKKGAGNEFQERALH